MKKEKSVSSKQRVDLPDGLTLEQSIELIYEHQKKCEKEGNYMEAEQAKRKVKELKDEYDRVTKDEIKIKHRQQREEIEQAHLEQLKHFNAEWDSIQNQFENEVTNVENQMLERHAEELKLYEDELLVSLPAKQKDSPQLMNLKKIEENLAKHQNYVQAHKVQQRAQELERVESEKYLMQRGQKIKNMLNQLRSKQDGQLNALRQKVLSGLQEKRRQRNVELQKMTQKYMIVKKDLQYQQNQELGRFDRTLKNQSSMYSSTASKSMLSTRSKH